MRQTEAQKAIEAKAIAHKREQKRAHWRALNKVAKRDQLLAAVRSGQGEEFRLAHGWTEQGMFNSCNKIGVDWEQYQKRGKPADVPFVNGNKRQYKKYGRYTWYNDEDRAEVRAAVMRGEGEAYRVKQGLTHQAMSKLCNGLGVDWRYYDPHSPIRLARKAKLAYDEAALQKRIDDMKGKAHCDNCVLAQIIDGRAVACKDRNRPVNNSCPEYSRRKELYRS